MSNNAKSHFDKPRYKLSDLLAECNLNSFSPGGTSACMPPDMKAWDLMAPVGKELESSPDDHEFSL